MGATLSMVLALVFGMSGCIKPEAPNAEADILTFEVGKELFRPTKITNDEIVIALNQWTAVDKLAPTFTVTEGATVVPKSGTVLDFSQPQKYTVTSEDGKWSKVYTVRVVRPSQGEQPVYKYSFEGTVMAPYLKVVELDESKNVVLEWENGNFGAYFIEGNIPFTSQDDNGVRGKAVKMETRTTGAMGIGMKRPIAAGNIFLGNMDNSNLIFSPLEATQFGIPFTQEPILLTGYYKYQPGKEVTNAENKVIPNATDLFDVYAVLFETTDKIQYLDGNSVRNSPQIVKIAAIERERYGATSEWTKFEIPFAVMEGRAIDPGKLKAGKYKLSIIATSSANGANFEGAIGSTLWLDELELFCK